MLIPGNSFSGDNLRMPVVGGGMIGVNSGEVILNQAQAGVIANALEGGGMQNLQLEATIRGEDIKLALNNNSRRTGRGEYVTTRFKSTIK
jgi:NAD(P)H-dependent flavin oxidoreductase YrpB (nitropropane dioxygenase family)